MSWFWSFWVSVLKYRLCSFNIEFASFFYFGKTLLNYSSWVVLVHVLLWFLFLFAFFFEVSYELSIGSSLPIFQLTLLNISFNCLVCVIIHKTSGQICVYLKADLWFGIMSDYLKILFSFYWGNWRNWIIVSNEEYTFTVQQQTGRNDSLVPWDFLYYTV